MLDPIVIEPAGFDQKAAWQECSDYVEKCGGLTHDDGEPNWRAAFGADPGICSCPACGEHYWCWGRKQQCVTCGFVYPTNWWTNYTSGVDAGMRIAGRRVCPDPETDRRMVSYAKEKAMQNRGCPYFRYGLEHPVEDTFSERRRIDWKSVLSPQSPPLAQEAG